MLESLFGAPAVGHRFELPISDGPRNPIDLDSSRYGAYTWSMKVIPRGIKKSPGIAAGDLFVQETRAVTKKEIVRTISEEIGLTQLQTKEIVQKTFNAIVEALVGEGRIELRNFGVFEVKRRAPRKARNPRTGDKVFVPEKFVVTFKPGKEMEERVRELERQAALRAKLAADGSGPVTERLGATTSYKHSPDDGS
jgi:nucleoid DNA-binding protein